MIRMLNYNKEEFKKYQKMIKFQINNKQQQMQEIHSGKYKKYY